MQKVRIDPPVDDRGPVYVEHFRSNAVAGATRDFQDRSENRNDHDDRIRHNGDIPDGAIKAICAFIDALDAHLPEFAQMAEGTVCVLQKAVEIATMRAIYVTRGNVGGARSRPAERPLSKAKRPTGRPKKGAAA